MAASNPTSVRTVSMYFSPNCFHTASRDASYFAAIAFAWATCGGVSLSCSRQAGIAASADGDVALSALRRLPGLTSVGTWSWARAKAPPTTARQTARRMLTALRKLSEPDSARRQTDDERRMVLLHSWVTKHSEARGCEASAADSSPTLAFEISKSSPSGSRGG